MACLPGAARLAAAAAGFVVCAAVHLAAGPGAWARSPHRARAASGAHARPSAQTPSTASARAPRRQVVASRIDVLVDEAMASLELEQKLAQLLFIGFSGTETTPFLRRWVSERNVGGVALFARNLKHHQQIAALTAGIAQLAHGGVMPFIAVDQEGGRVVRLREGVSVLPSNMALGAVDSELHAYLAGRAAAVDLRALGFNMNLAPVLDVNSNPNNPVINIRSFGEHPRRVAALGEAFVRGQQAGALSSVAKHFPGHGDTATDSHFALPRLAADWPRLQAVEMPPFRAAIAAGVDAVMTAHIALPQIAQAGQTPATLSRPIITGLLRQALKYDGIVITDGLEMQGVAKQYGVGRAAVRAVEAGADMPMVLWSDEACEEAFAALVNAAHNDPDFVALAETAARRILLAKARRGLLGPLAPAIATDDDAIAMDELPADGRGPPRRSGPAATPHSAAANPVHEALMAQIAQRALTLLGNSDHTVPLPAQVHGWLALGPPGPLLTAAAARGAQAIALPLAATRSEREHALEAIERLAPGAVGLLGAALHPSQLEALAAARAAAGPRVPYVFVALGSPYLVRDVPDAAATLLTYSPLPASEEAAVCALWGQAPITAAAPITLQAAGEPWPTPP